MADRPRGPSKNPSTTFFWNDWDNDEALKACSLAAQGLWMRCLCIAARSPEPGVVMIGGFPAGRADIVPRLAAVVGHPLDAVNALIDELLTSGTASLDRKNRIINRRMVKAAALHRKRSEAGKAGAAASARSRTPLSQADGQHDDENGGRFDNDVSDWENYENEGLPRQNAGKHPSKPPAKPSANGSPSSRLQDFSASESPPATATPSVASSRSGDEQPTTRTTIPPFLRQTGLKVAAQVPLDFEPQPSTRDALKTARPDLDDAIIERRHAEFLSWCATNNITTHNFDATWYSFMVKTHEQRGRSQQQQSNIRDNLEALAEFGRTRDR